MKTETLTAQRLIDANALRKELRILIDCENDGTEAMKMFDTWVKNAIYLLENAPTVETTTLRA